MGSFVIDNSYLTDAFCRCTIISRKINTSTHFFIGFHPKGVNLSLNNQNYWEFGSYSVKYRTSLTILMWVSQHTHLCRWKDNCSSSPKLQIQFPGKLSLFTFHTLPSLQSFLNVCWVLTRLTKINGIWIQLSIMIKLFISKSVLLFQISSSFF